MKRGLRARRAFGNILLAEEHFCESRPMLWRDYLRQNAGYALRQLGRNSFVPLTSASGDPGLMSITYRDGPFRLMS
jgi:hypothetical protein